MLLGATYERSATHEITQQEVQKHRRLPHRFDMTTTQLQKHSRWTGPSVQLVLRPVLTRLSHSRTLNLMTQSEGTGCRLCSLVVLAPAHRLMPLLSQHLRTISKNPPPIRKEQICFWDLKTGERRVKQHRDLKLICGSGEHVCLTTGPNDKGRSVIVSQISRQSFRTAESGIQLRIKWG